MNTDAMILRHLMRNVINYATILIVLGLMVLMIWGGSEWLEYYDNIPIIEREVFTVIVDDGYDECLFIVDGERLLTNDYPCEYKEGEMVKTKVIGSKINIIEDNQ